MRHQSLGIMRIGYVIYLPIQSLPKSLFQKPSLNKSTCANERWDGGWGSWLPIGGIGWRVASFIRRQFFCHCSPCTRTPTTQGIPDQHHKMYVHWFPTRSSCYQDRQDRHVSLGFNGVDGGDCDWGGVRSRLRG